MKHLENETKNQQKKNRTEKWHRARI